MTDKPIEYLTEQQACDLLGIKASTLRTWRSNNVNIPYVRVNGKFIRYIRSDIDVFMLNRKVTPPTNLETA